MKIIERYPAGFRFLRGKGAWTLFYPLRLVLSWGYGLWLIARGNPARRRSRPRSRAGGEGRPFVVSVGNLETGGGGKTPCALMIAQAIAGRGGSAVVVSRGYRSVAERRAPCVVPAGRKTRQAGSGAFTVDEALFREAAGNSRRPVRVAAILGDEILLYRNRGIPVVIDRDRSRGCRIARELFAPTHIILDDAYQNHAAQKDFEILLLDAAAPFGSGRVIPLGTLREDPRAARRADAVIFTRGASAERVPGEAEPFVAGAQVFFAAHTPVDLVSAEGVPAPLSLLEGRSCVLFSGIARPGSFEETVRSLDARPRAAFRFIDHHPYDAGDVRAMLGEGAKDTLYVTTEKDLGRVEGLFPPGVTVLAVRIEMRMSGLERLLGLLATSSS